MSNTGFLNDCFLCLSVAVWEHTHVYNSLGLKTRVKKLFAGESGIYQEPYTVFIFFLRTRGNLVFWGRQRITIPLKVLKLQYFLGTVKSLQMIEAESVKV